MYIITTFRLINLPNLQIKKRKKYFCTRNLEIANIPRDKMASVPSYLFITDNSVQIWDKSVPGKICEKRPGISPVYLDTGMKHRVFAFQRSAVNRSA